MTGSYPLLDLAREFGLDYGDVLLLAHWTGALVRGQPLSDERVRECSMAHGRILRRMVGLAHWDNRKAFHARLTAHAEARWIPEPAR